MPHAVPLSAMTEPASPEAAADLASARRTLAAEAEALTVLAASLNGAFTDAVATLAAVKGRVVVTGMGKSGHVARKIAATLASTGTPAFFVHPGEASHGDLGMITTDDAIIALSNSGETAELADTIAFSRRFAIPLVGITSRPRSTLAEASDIALVLPPMGEACPHGLAPTTSTTMMLALGDAIAVALLERKGFSAADFKVFHPGGSLGNRLLKVADLMHKGEEVPLCGLDTAMSEALLIMTGKHFGCVGITDAAGRLAGIITDGDLRRHMDSDLPVRRAEEVMTKAPKAIGPSVVAQEALRQMNANGVTALFAVEDGRPVGILHVHDLLRAGVM